MLEFDGEYLAGHPEGLTFALEILEKSAVKHSIRKPNLLNFVNFYTIFCARLSFVTQPRPFQLTFSVDFSISEDPCTLKTFI